MRSEIHINFSQTKTKNKCKFLAHSYISSAMHFANFRFWNDPYSTTRKWYLTWVNWHLALSCGQHTQYHCHTAVANLPNILSILLATISELAFVIYLEHLSSSQQCTMRFPMSIEILEIHKCKNSFHAHFLVKSIHSFFRWCKTAQSFTKENKYFFSSNFFVIFLWKMLKGGSEKGEILVIFKLRYLQKKSPK